MGTKEGIGCTFTAGSSSIGLRAKKGCQQNRVLRLRIRRFFERKQIIRTRLNSHYKVWNYKNMKMTDEKHVGKPIKENPTSTGFNWFQKPFHLSLKITSYRYSVNKWKSKERNIYTEKLLNRLAPSTMRLNLRT